MSQPEARDQGKKTWEKRISGTFLSRGKEGPSLYDWGNMGKRGNDYCPYTVRSAAVAKGRRKKRRKLL